MRKILNGGLAAALLLGGTAFAADPDTHTQNTDQAQTGQLHQDRNTGTDKVVANPAQPTKPSDAATRATDEAPDAMANQAGQNSLQGQITKVKKDRISLKAQGGQKQDVYVDQGSAVLRDGQAVQVKDLKKGDAVRVSYDVRDGKQYATTITATSKDASKKGTSAQSKPGHNPSGSSINQPVPANAPPTGEGTQPDKSLDDRSFNGNTPGTNYRKESGDQSPNTRNAGVKGNIGVQPDQQPGAQDQSGTDPYGRQVNPKSGIPSGDQNQNPTNP